MRTCTVCREDKPLTAFSLRPSGVVVAACKPCDSARRRVYQARAKANGARSKTASYFRHWKALNNENMRAQARRVGLTLGDYEALFLFQGQRCAACWTSTPGKKGFAIDHCHDTGQVRAFLCQPCNIAAGMVGDDPDRLDALAAYLRSHQ